MDAVAATVPLSNYFLAESRAGYGYGNGDGYGDGDGYSNGNGDGYGYGYGNGNGDGDGNGDGYGDGDGYSNGNGDGYGYGYGNGNGNGYGYGDGNGDGYGNGNGYGPLEYWTEVIAIACRGWDDAGRRRVELALEAGAKLAFWKSDHQGRPANGGKGGPVEIGQVQMEKGPLSLCHKGTLHATLQPENWQGARWWIVAMYPPFEEGEDKIGALRREILGEVV